MFPKIFNLSRRSYISGFKIKIVNNWHQNYSANSHLYITKTKGKIELHHASLSRRILRGTKPQILTFFKIIYFI